MQGHLGRWAPNEKDPNDDDSEAGQDQGGDSSYADHLHNLLQIGYDRNCNVKAR
jgi:hypothetical protein